jgi:uncharacterized protein
MVIGIIQVELSIPWATSLKDKRSVVKSLKDRLRQKFNVAVAEVGANDVWQTAMLGMTTVANDPKFVRSVCDTVVSYIEQNCEAQIADFEVEVL